MHGKVHSFLQKQALKTQSFVALVIRYCGAEAYFRCEQEPLARHECLLGYSLHVI